mgnify:FL=1
MAYFAKLDENNYVIEVHCVANEALDSNNEEQSGIDFLTQWSNGYTNWKQTSYNNRIRKNYAGIGYTYDETRDAFIPPKPFNSWVLNESTCRWDAPVPFPADGKKYIWNEQSLSWDEV